MMQRDDRSKRPKTPAVAASTEVSDESVETASEAAEYHAAYQAYADTFRNWLVAYGIGGPLLFLSREEVYEKVSTSGLAPWILVFFLLGVGFQVGLALLNKWVNWRIYAGMVDPKWRTQPLYARACKISEKAWIDFAIDVATLIAFGFATAMTLSVFASPMPLTS